ncbi:hydroxyethylthiazole kinase [Shouchella sp. JSM 1781072]|uniref:hydroxyethylthiazole kinase n=1 Tax=Shouchella sp. JSM 1781072 TaxID=3344581 RepID=UPI0035C19AB9
MSIVRDHQPLIHCMTNAVVTNFTANGLLAVGASPVMAYAIEETHEMATAADALLLNIGTPSETVVASMIHAGQAANKKGIPVILDPVGVGATTFRNQIVARILEEVNISLVRGNAGEIAAVLGEAGTVKGVDTNIKTDPVALAKKAAEQLQTVVVVTGEKDVVTNGKQIVQVSNGHEWLTRVVGTGCLLGGVLAAYLAVNGKDFVNAAANGLAFYGVAAERAYAKANEYGVASFQMEFLNELSMIKEEEAEPFYRIEWL